jgi:uncharacterized protein with HEPN domain
MASHGRFPGRLIHAYEGVDLKRVWWIVRQDLPVVKEAIEKLLPPLEELEKELAQSEIDKEKSKK